MSIGVHLSKSDLDHQIALTKAEVVQIFISNPRGYQHPSRDAMKSIKCDKPIYIHLPYLVNFASAKESVRDLSKELLIATDKICDSRVLGIVVHGGQGGKDATVEEAIERWIESLSGIKLNTTLLIENTAGGNAAPGRNSNDLIKLITKLRREDNQIGICYDTCHAFASGSENFIEEIEKIKFILGKLDLIHLNNSKDPINSSRDRHELLSEGEIDIKEINSLVKYAKKEFIDLILETPGDLEIWNKEIYYIKNI
jgi:deoxyribonuclease-4